jgi:hypothetical protein
MLIIPLASDPNQNFMMTLYVDGRNIDLEFDIRYNAQSRLWIMGLTDYATGEILVDCIPLMTGVYPAGNLLEQFGYLNIGSCCVVKIDPDCPLEHPDDKTLGTAFVMGWDDTL